MGNRKLRRKIWRMPGDFMQKNWNQNLIEIGIKN